MTALEVAVTKTPGRVAISVFHFTHRWRRTNITRYRYRAVLLLFLVLNLTACYTWQGVATTSPAQLIEATRPDRVRVVVPAGIQMELERPVVDGDQLVGTSVENERVGGAINQTFVPTVSVPVADILMLEIREFSMGRTIGLVFLSLLAASALQTIGQYGF